MLAANDYLFYILAFIAVLCGLGVIFNRNPIYSALNLALSMISIAGVFSTLGAYFIAGVQLIVYAGAVMVLFVMVLMLFDLKHEVKAFSKGLISGMVKLVSIGLILGLIMGAISMTAETLFAPQPTLSIQGMDSTRIMAQTLFTKYLFGFEVIGLLLTIIAIGAVTLSRIAGGTHADS